MFKQAQALFLYWQVFCTGSFFAFLGRGAGLKNLFKQAKKFV
jgi:hypothetical protein